MGTIVMLSVKPRYCELIANGKKTIEIRKSVPDMGKSVCKELIGEGKIKAYIYCTKGGNDRNPSMNLWKSDSTGFNWLLNGKVIGEFCIYGLDIESYCYTDYDLRHINRDEWTNRLLQKACVTREDFIRYAKSEKCYSDIHFWPIYNLIIYDKPRPLSDFCNRSSVFENGRFSGITKPPQSWYYCAEV